MKNKSNAKKQTKEMDTFIKGPLMVYRPWTMEEEIEMADWVAKRKAAAKEKKPKQ